MGGQISGILVRLRNWLFAWLVGLRDWIGAGLVRLRDWAYTWPAPPILRSLVEMVYRTIRNFIRDDGSHMAAGVAYYAIFSLFPLVLGAISIASIILNEGTVSDYIIGVLRDNIGIGSEDLVSSNIRALLALRGTVSIVAILTLLWASRSVFGAVHRVMNRAWKVTEPPRFLTYHLAQIGAAMGVAIMFMVPATLGPAGRAFAQRNDTLFGWSVPWATIFTVLPFLIAWVLFLLIYRYVPDAKVRWRDAYPAATVAAGLFEAAKWGFAFYLVNLSSLDLVYGSVTTIIVLMLFLYIVAIILVLGAELASEYHLSSTSEVLIFRGHWKPVKGGLKPLPHRELPSKPVNPQGMEMPSVAIARARARARMQAIARAKERAEELAVKAGASELDLPKRRLPRERPPGI